MNEQGVISIRFSPDEAAELRRMADRAGVSVSNYLRTIARDEIGAEQRREMALMPGAREFHTTAGGHVVMVPTAGAHVVIVPVTTKATS